MLFKAVDQSYTQQKVLRTLKVFRHQTAENMPDVH